jgi:hypothetical protein
MKDQRSGTTRSGGSQGGRSPGGWRWRDSGAARGAMRVGLVTPSAGSLAYAYTHKGQGLKKNPSAQGAEGPKKSTPVSKKPTSPKKRSK